MRRPIRRPLRSGLLNIEKLLTAEFAEEERRERREEQNNFTSSRLVLRDSFSPLQNRHEGPRQGPVKASKDL